MNTKKELTAIETATLLDLLKKRFEKNAVRHIGLEWTQIEERLLVDAAKLWSIGEMERTGGEPDVVVLGGTDEGIVFYDCSPESPKGRRSISYDPAAIESRKEHKPAHSAIGMAAEMGVSILNEEQYRKLQEYVELDMKTSSWVETPGDVRKLGGAIFCDRRYGRIFTYHNGAESYYAARGFRSFLTL